MSRVRAAEGSWRLGWVVDVVAGAAVVLLVVVIATAPSLGQSERGQMLFRDQGCADCHTVGALGTPAGPDLSHVGSKYSAEYLREWLRDPASRRPWAHMPNPQLTRPEIDALAEYLASQT